MPEPQRKAAIVPPGDGAHLAWLGERLSYLVVGEQTAGRYAVSKATVAPGGGPVPRVRHRDHAGFYVLSGSLSFAVGNRTLSLPAGGFLNVPPGVAHHVVNEGTEPAELLAVSGPAGFDEFQLRSGYPLPRPDAPIPPATDEDRQTLAALVGGYGVEPHPPAAAFRSEPRFRLTLPGEGTTIAVVGDLYRFLAVSEDTGGRYALWQAALPAGGGPPWHSHSREDEAFLVLKGMVTFHVDGTERPVGPGGFVHLPSGTRHRFANKSGETAEMLILVAPAGLEKMFESVGRVWHDPASMPGPPEPAEIERLVEEAPKYGIELFL